MLENVIRLIRPFTFAGSIILLDGVLVWVLSTQREGGEGNMQTVITAMTATPVGDLNPAATPLSPPTVTMMLTVVPTRLVTPTTTPTSTPLPPSAVTATATIPISMPRIVKGSPYPPTLIPTPSPTRNVTFEVVGKQQIPLDNLWAVLDVQPPDIPFLKDWTEREGIVFNAGYADGHDLTWQLSPETGEVQAREVWQKPTYMPAVQETIDQIKTFDPHAYQIFVSPNQQWVAWRSITSLGDLLVKKVGDNAPPFSLLAEDKPKQFTGFAAWSPSSQHLAYIIDRGDHQLHIEAIDGTSHVMYSLTERLPTALTWSPDEQLIAFIGGEEPQQDTDIYIARVDGSDIFNVTNDDLWPTKPVWHPHKHIVAYSVMNAGRVGLWQVEIKEPEE